MDYRIKTVLHMVRALHKAKTTLLKYLPQPKHRDTEVVLDSFPRTNNYSWNQVSTNHDTILLFRNYPSPSPTRLSGCSLLCCLLLFSFTSSTLAMLGHEEKDRRAWLDIPLPVKELIAGGIAGGVAKTAVAPLERVKILFQTRRAEFQGSGLAGSFRKIFQTEGLLGFYRGNGASVARIIPYAALHYMAYEQYRRWIILAYPAVNQGPVLDLMAGSISGATAVIFTYPLDLVRTKLAYQVRTSSKLVPVNMDIYKGIFDCIEKVFRKNGLRGLYHGIAPSLYGIFPYAGLKFYFYEEMKRRVPVEHKKNVFVNLACGSIAGLLSQTITYPLDVVRRQMQVQALAGPDQLKMRGTLAILITIAKTEGWRQLFSGLSINYLKVVPSVAIGFTMYDLMKHWLEVPSRDNAAVARER